MRSSSIVLVLLNVMAIVMSHATFQELWINGVDQVGSCVRLPPSNSPVTDLTSTDLRYVSCQVSFNLSLWYVEDSILTMCPDATSVVQLV